MKFHVRREAKSYCTNLMLYDVWIKRLTPLNVPKMGKLSRWITHALLASLIGLTSGSLSAIFLISLAAVTRYRLDHDYLLYFLPVAGLLTGFAYKKWGRSIAKGNQLLVEEITSPRQKVPLRMMPMVLIGTLITHLFGGSAGREGTAIQMSGAVADHIGHSKWSRNHGLSRKYLLIAGIAAGFAGVFGTPITAMVFAFEVLKLQRHRLEAFFGVFIASITAHYACLSWGVHHSHYPTPKIPDLSADWDTLSTLIRLVLLGIIFGILAMSFVWLSHQIKAWWNKTTPSEPLRAFVGGLAILLLTYLVSTKQYLGLGLPQIREAFDQASGVLDPVLKIIFTAVTVGSGFQGGEVTPLFFVGATAGSAFAAWLSLNLTFAAALGFTSVFGAAAKTPLAATIMACELFGIHIFPYAFTVCFASWAVGSHRGLYESPQPKH